MANAFLQLGGDEMPRRLKLATRRAGMRHVKISGVILTSSSCGVAKRNQLITKKMTTLCVIMTMAL